MLYIAKKLMWPLRLLRIGAEDLNVAKIGGLPAIPLPTVGLIDPTSITITNQIIITLTIGLIFGTMDNPKFIKIILLERDHRGLLI
jgi:hypothetical protein